MKEFKDGELVSLLSDDKENAYINKLCAVLMTKGLIMHNGVFDIVVIRNQYDIDLTPALEADTILMKHTLESEPPFGLKDIAAKYQKEIGIPADELANQEQLELKESVIKNGGKWTKKQKDIYKGDTAIIGKYACADVDLTMRFYDFFSLKLERENLLDFFYNQEVMPLYKQGTIPMKLNGVFVDVQYFKNLKKEVEDGIISLTAEIFDDIKPLVAPKVKEILAKGVKITSKGEFARRVLQYYKVPIPSNPKTGKPSLAKSFLQSLSDNYPDHPVIEFLVNGTPLPEDVVFSVQKEIFAEANPDLPHVFNLSSNEHLSWLLFDHYKCKPVSFSRKTGKAQVNKDSLGHYKHVPFVAKFLKLKKEEKLLNSYILPILQKELDGWIYPEMFQFGTTSGRYSCGGGLNLQTLPRDDKRIKKGFIAPPGYKIVNADFSALEPRIFSWVTNDPGLKYVWSKNLDLYSEIAISVFGLEGVSSDPKSPKYLKKLMPEMRDKSKVLTLSVVYGANAFRLAQLMKVENEEAQQIIDNYLDAYPGLRDYMETQSKLAIAMGKVTTKFGRIRRLPEAEKLYKRYGKAIFSKRKMKDNHAEGEFFYYKFRNLINNSRNFPIQATAAHVTNAAIIKLSAELKKHNIDGWIALTVHDEITMIINESQAPRAAEILQDSMENNCITQQMDVAIVAEPIIADNFLDAK